jgi:hypothetical protein
VITITQPDWVDNDVHYLLEMSIVAGAGGGTSKYLGAITNFIFRVNLPIIQTYNGALVI